MMALNFVDEGHERMLRARTKDCTVRMGDVSALYPQGSVVYITVGAKGEPKHRLYTAYLEKVRSMTMVTLTTSCHYSFPLKQTYHSSLCNAFMRACISGRSSEPFFTTRMFT